MKSVSFSIVLPVRNGGEHLKQAVSSVLAQTMQDFELVILENHSTDGTREWLDSLTDPRIRVYPATKPLEMADNWARALDVPKREFVTFMGHDDLLDPNYLETMCDLIVAHPEAALYHAHFRFIDEKGDIINSCRPMPEREDTAEFYRAFFHWERDANGTGYMVRSKDFDRLGGFPKFPKLLNADHALWLSVVRDSCIITSPKECFSYRIHSSSTTSSAHWREYLEALKAFLEFSIQVKSWNESVKKAVESHAANYFFQSFVIWYAIAIVQYTKQNRRVPPQIRQELVTSLGKLSSEHAKQFSVLRSLRLRHAINASFFTRFLYISYIRLRHGKSELITDSKR